MINLQDTQILYSYASALPIPPPFPLVFFLLLMIINTTHRTTAQIRADKSGLTKSQTMSMVHPQTMRVRTNDISPVPILRISAINGIIFAIMTMSQNMRLNPINRRRSPTHRRIQAIKILSLFAFSYICSMEAFPYWSSTIFVSVFVVYGMRFSHHCCPITLTSAGYTAENETRRSPISGAERLPLAVPIYTVLFSMFTFDIAYVFFSLWKTRHF
jgi:hypothetical protein